MTDNLTTEFILGGTDDDIKAMLKVARSSFEKSGSEYSFQLGHIKDLDIDDLLVQRDGKGNIKMGQSFLMWGEHVSALPG